VNRYAILIAVLAVAASGVCAQTIVDVYPFNVPLATGSTTSTAVTHNANINAPGGPIGKECGWAKFDLSTIPTGATVSSVVLYINVTTTNWPYWSCTPVTADPLVATPATLQADIVAEENSGNYIMPNEASSYAPGPKQYTLGGTINTDVQNNLAAGWIALGFCDRDTTATYYVNFSGYDAGTNRPYLKITYTGGGPAVTGAATAGTAQTVFSNAQGPGGNGLRAATFTMATNNLGPMAITNIDLKASGTGDDSTAFTEVAIYRDFNANGTFEFGTDTAVIAPATFSANDGTISAAVITSEQGLGASETRTYFVIAKLAGLASPGQTFNFQITDITVASGFKAGFPTPVINGLIIDTPVFQFTDTSLPTAATVYLGTGEHVCQQFSISYPAGPSDKPVSVTVTGLGTADEVADLTAVQLWLDADSSDTFSSGADTMIDSGAYSADNGTITFSMASETDFTAGQTRTYFVVYDLGLTAADNDTFKCYVSAAAVSGLNPNVAGLPAPGPTGTAGLVVSANVLIVTMNGPSVPVVVDSNTSGMTGDGVLLCDVTLGAAPGGAWMVTSMTFNASGTGSHDTAYNELGLYIDDSSGTWDGAGTDLAAAATATGFSGGAVTFTLSATNFAAGSNTRFFLVGKMNGTALAAETFNANLESLSYVAPPGGLPSGLPTIASSAVVIDVASLTIFNGPAVPALQIHLAGGAASYVVGRFSLFALNASVTVNGITLTTAGSGDWTTDVDSTSGVEIYLDDGDGVFSATSDSLLYQGGGAAVVAATFGTSVMMPGATGEDLWVRIGLTATAGAGVAAAPETFSMSIANTSDVAASTNVVFGSPAPATVTVSAIEFNVSAFSPPADVPKGGKAVSIAGSGFMTPLSVTIGGIQCPGSAIIVGGTQVTGLTVPPGGGKNLPIVVNSGALPPQTLSQTFTYKLVSETGGDSGGGNCSGGTGPWLPVLAGFLLMLVAGGLWRRRSA
jgi:hypothetical protein